MVALREHGRHSVAYGVQRAVLVYIQVGRIIPSVPILTTLPHSLSHSLDIPFKETHPNQDSQAQTCRRRQSSQPTLQTPRSPQNHQTKNPPHRKATQSHPISSHPKLTTTTTNSPCPIHPASPTPHIDTHLHQPSNRSYLLSISEALADLADSEGAHCTKCAIDNVAETLTKLLRDVKMAKKNGEWTKEEKKALKKEAKMLGKGVKGECERVWREGEKEGKGKGKM